MAEHCLWRLLSVKVQAMRTLGIFESHCKQVSINIFTSEVQEIKLSPAQMYLTSELSSPSSGRSRISGFSR